MNLGLQLSEEEYEFIDQFAGQFEDIDITPYRSFYKNIAPLSVETARGWVKDGFENIGADISNGHNRDKGNNYTGMMELVRALRENFDFAKNDMGGKGYKYDLQKNADLSLFFK